MVRMRWLSENRTGKGKGAATDDSKNFVSETVEEIDSSSSKFHWKPEWTSRIWPFKTKPEKESPSEPSRITSKDKREEIEAHDDLSHKATNEIINIQSTDKEAEGTLSKGQLPGLDQNTQFSGSETAAVQTAPLQMATALENLTVMQVTSSEGSSGVTRQYAQGMGIECNLPAHDDAADSPKAPDDISGVAASQSPQVVRRIQFVATNHTDAAQTSGITKVKRTLTFERAQSIVAVSKMIWDEAFAALDENEKEILKNIAASIQATFTFDSLTRSVKERKVAEERKRGAMLTFEWRGRKFNLTKLMDNVITWVGRFKQIGDIIVQYDPAHMALPWAATRFLLQIVVEDKENMAAITLSLERVTNVTALSAIYIGMYFDEQNLSRSCLSLLKKSLVNLHQHVLSFLSSCIRYWKRKRSGIAASLFESDGFEERLLNIDNLMIQLKEAVDAADMEVKRLHNRSTNNTFHRLECLLDGLGTKLDALQRTTEALGRDIENQKRRDLLAWISDCPYEAHHATAGKDILEGTGQWLFGCKEYMTWEMSNESCIFWLKGEPGVGKTYLTHAAIERPCQDLYEPTVYFYCSRSSQQDDSRTNPTAILRALLKGLLIRTAIHPQTANLVDRYNARNEMGDLRLDESKSALIKILHQEPCVRAKIFIDALDEINENDRLNLFKAICEIARDTSVRLWLSSRPKQRIQYQIITRLPQVAQRPNSATAIVHTLSVDKQNIAEINEFIKREVRDSIENGQLLFDDDDVEDSEGAQPTLNSTIEDLIVQKLVEKADGMFLWARLQILELHKARNLTQLYKQLDSLPRGLMGTYDGIYRTITEESGDTCEDAKNALRWLMCARRPLTAQEWVELVALDSKSKDVTQSYLRRICNNLVTIDTGKEVRLIHLSVKEFLETQKDFNAILPDEMAAKLCLSPLTKLPLQTTIPTYAFEYWPVHCREALSRLSSSMAHTIGGEEVPFSVRQSRMTELLALQRQFFQSQAAHKSWLEHIKEAEISSDLDPLFTSARYGLSEILEEMAQNPQQFHIKPGSVDGTQSNPLHIAIRFNQKVAVETILRYATKLLDVNAQDKEGRTPFAFAVFLKHDAIVQTLLSYPEVDVNKVDAIGEYPPLVRAVWQENEEMVKVLTRVPPSRLNVDACDITGRTALHWAVRRGNTAIVKLLLAAGVDVNIRDKITQSPPLLDLISILTKFSWTKLRGSGNYAQDRGGHKVSPTEGAAILQELCNHPQINVNYAVPFQKINALSMFAMANCDNANEEEYIMGLCRILLTAKGIDLNAPGLWGSTAIEVMGYQRFPNRRLTTLLLEDNRWDVNSVSSATLGKRTALHFSVESNSADLVNLLLTSPQINTRIRDIRGDTPLMRAMVMLKKHRTSPFSFFMGAVGVARSLLVFEKVTIADISELTNLSQSAIFDLLVDGHSSIYVQSGDDSHEHQRAETLSDAAMGCYRLAEVFRAAAEDDKDVAKEKLSQLDVNTVDETGMTVLHMACCAFGNFYSPAVGFIYEEGRKPSSQQYNRAITNLLATPGIDISKVDVVGFNVLSGAAQAHYHDAILQLRKIAGIEMNSSTGYGGWSPLAAFTSGLRACHGCSVVETLIEDERLDVNAPFPWGELPINFALKELNRHGYDSHAFAKSLLDTGRVDLNAKDLSTGKTPLGTAVLTGIPKALQLILEHQTFTAANLDTPDHDWNSPLGLAVGAEKQSEEIIRTLLEKGADLTWRNYRGNAPLDIAINHERGNPRVVELLNNAMK